jgi:two-component system NarL family sensor kinase
MQESLTNIFRHAKSSVVDVTFRQTRDQAILSIRDYGKGIAPERLKAFELTGSGMGVGLAGMRERLREVGGNLKIESSPEGTCVTATLSSCATEKILQETTAA